jgi:hypothetical protein
MTCVALPIRVFPAALAFARSEESISLSSLPASTAGWGSFISGNLNAASLSEVLDYDPAKEKGCYYDPNKAVNPCIHDEAKFISEGNGRKWILTNTKFQSYWSPGFWEEVDPARVPPSMQFAVKISLPADFRHYGAYRMGNRIFIMTDYSGGTPTAARDRSAVDQAPNIQPEYRALGS